MAACIYDGEAVESAAIEHRVNLLDTDYFSKAGYRSGHDISGLEGASRRRSAFGQEWNPF